ncbi:MAG TPA: type II toxin-antitoxin system HigB family toxin [Terriglobia bacterium]|nr:type II toxin-antitoxin system HigB family toxin [Terriglobia bacterium]
MQSGSRYGNMGFGRDVHVISYKAIREFKAARRDAGPALDNWYRVSSACKWTSFAEVKQVLGNADWVKPYVVFNIAGNKYRLIAEINFRSQTLFIRHILPHQEYAEGKWKQP